MVGGNYTQRKGLIKQKIGWEVGKRMGLLMTNRPLLHGDDTESATLQLTESLPKVKLLSKRIYKGMCQQRCMK